MTTTTTNDEASVIQAIQADPPDAFVAIQKELATADKILDDIRAILLETKYKTPLRATFESVDQLVRISALVQGKYMHPGSSLWDALDLCNKHINRNKTKDEAIQMVQATLIATMNTMPPTMVFDRTHLGATYPSSVAYEDRHDMIPDDAIVKRARRGL